MGGVGAAGGRHDASLPNKSLVYRVRYSLGSAGTTMDLDCVVRSVRASTTRRGAATGLRKVRESTIRARGAEDRPRPDA